jgi:hypothetical protein
MMPMFPLYGDVSLVTVALELLRYCKLIAKNQYPSLNSTLVGYVNHRVPHI